MSSLSEKQVRNIIAQELKAHRRLHKALGHLKEDVDHEGIKTVVNNASKLLKALNTFTEAELTGAMVNATEGNVSTLKQTLESMIENPGTYVDRKKIEPRRIELRQQKKTSK